MFAYWKWLLAFKPNISDLVAEATTLFALNHTGAWLAAKGEAERNAIILKAQRDVHSSEVQSKASGNSRSEVGKSGEREGGIGKKGEGKKGGDEATHAENRGTRFVAFTCRNRRGSREDVNGKTRRGAGKVGSSQRPNQLQKKGFEAEVRFGQTDFVF